MTAPSSCTRTSLLWPEVSVGGQAQHRRSTRMAGSHHLEPSHCPHGDEWRWASTSSNGSRRRANESEGSSSSRSESRHRRTRSAPLLFPATFVTSTATPQGLHAPHLRPYPVPAPPDPSSTTHDDSLSISAATWPEGPPRVLRLASERDRGKLVTAINGQPQVSPHASSSTHRGMSRPGQELGPSSSFYRISVSASASRANSPERGPSAHDLGTHGPPPTSRLPASGHDYRFGRRDVRASASAHTFSAGNAGDMASSGSSLPGPPSAISSARSSRRGSEYTTATASPTTSISTAASATTAGPSTAWESHRSQSAFAESVRTEYTDDQARTSIHTSSSSAPFVDHPNVRVPPSAAFSSPARDTCSGTSRDHATNTPTPFLSLDSLHQAVSVSIYIGLSVMAGLALLGILAASYALTMADDMRGRIGDVLVRANSVGRQIKDGLLEQAEAIKSLQQDRNLRAGVFKTFVPGSGQSVPSSSRTSGARTPTEAPTASYPSQHPSFGAYRSGQQRRNANTSTQTFIWRLWVRACFCFRLH